jgi:signal peptidase I
MTHNITLGCQESTSLVREILDTGARIRIKVTGSSMEPVLSCGDVVTVEKVIFRSLWIGDLVLFMNQYQSPVLHRLIQKKVASDGTTSMQTKGDALLVCDEPFPENEFLGKVCIIEKRNSGRIINRAYVHHQVINFLFAIFQRCKSGILVFMKPGLHSMR